jgi:hypothetical protein
VHRAPVDDDNDDDDDDDDHHHHHQRIGIGPGTGCSVLLLVTTN